MLGRAARFTGSAHTRSSRGDVGDRDGWRRSAGAAGARGIASCATRLGAVHDGQRRASKATYRAEVQPLVDDLNALLDQRERRSPRAPSRKPATSRMA